MPIAACSNVASRRWPAPPSGTAYSAVHPGTVESGVSMVVSPEVLKRAIQASSRGNERGARYLSPARSRLKCRIQGAEGTEGNCRAVPTSIELAEVPQPWNLPRRDCDDTECEQPAEHHRPHCPEQLGGDPGLERADLVGRSDEYLVRCRNASEQMRRRAQRQQRRADHHTDVIDHPADEKERERQPEPS